MKRKFTLIDLGLTKNELSDFVNLLEPQHKRDWKLDKIISYKDASKYSDDINNSELIILSPGNAPVGLSTDERFSKYPDFAEFVSELKEYIVESKKPVLGINAGHQLLNASFYGHALQKIPKNYTKNIIVDKDSLNGPVFTGIDKLSMNLSNDYGVMDIKQSLIDGTQKRRDKQIFFYDVLTHDNFSLISKGNCNLQFSTQFNIEHGNEKVFYNYFRSVEKILRDREKMFKR